MDPSLETSLVLELDGGNPVKRRRKNTVSKIKSCAECRRLKMKCDREVPCVNCTRRGCTHLCPNGALQTTKRRNLNAEGNEVLQERIASLELALNQLTSAQGGHPLLDKSALPGHSPSSDRGTTDWEHEIAHGAGRASESTQEFDGTSALYHPRRNGQHGSARGGPGLLSGQDQDPSQAGPSDPKSTRFFGDASSLFLAAEQGSSSTSGHVKGDGPYAFRPGWIESFVFERDSAFQLDSTLQSLVSQLPQKEQAEKLVDIYFADVAWGSAILDRETFMQDCFGRFYNVPRQPQAQQLAILYFVFALSALFDPSLPAGANNNPWSRDLFALGRACLALDSSGTILFVQAVHLMITWLHNGGRPVSSNLSTWPLLGMAMKVIQALGLHRDGEHFGLPQEEVMSRRRIFWELFAYDIHHSVTIARPRSMAEGTYDAGYPATAEGGEHYHEVRYRLAQIYSKINDKQIAIKPLSYDKVIEIDRELRQFQQQLPDQLVKEEPLSRAKHPSSRTHHIQRHTMRFRVNLAFLTLHREYFARALTEGAEEPLRSKFCPSFVGCLEACKILIAVVRRLSDDMPAICQRRWFFHFNVFTACACLAAAVIRAPQSMLAQSSLLALEEGIKLFEEAGKEKELLVLRPLHDTAQRVFARSGGPVTSDEDLALLGKASRRANSVSSVPGARSSGPSHAQPPTPVPSIASLTAERPAPSISPSAVSKGMPSLISPDASMHDGVASLLSLQRSVDNPTLASTHLSTPFLQPSLGVDPLNLQQNFDSIDWFDGSTSAADFDADAFLASFGFGMNNNEPLWLESGEPGGSFI